jgi:hypothetical protein
MATRFTDAVASLQRHFPEYVIPDKESTDLAYVVYADFADRIRGSIEGGGHKELIQKVFDFINSEFKDPNADTEYLNLLQVEIFENLAQSKSGIEAARINLRGDARTWFEKTLEYTGALPPVDGGQRHE